MSEIVHQHTIWPLYHKDFGLLEVTSSIIALLDQLSESANMARHELPYDQLREKVMVSQRRIEYVKPFEALW